tara:strand:+ start:667 stop:858 length:192 start_codon:yes stop_codon:yes gene_type:complete
LVLAARVVLAVLAVLAAQVVVLAPLVLLVNQAAQVLLVVMGGIVLGVLSVLILRLLVSFKTVL